MPFQAKGFFAREVARLEHVNRRCYLKAEAFFAGEDVVCSHHSLLWAHHAPGCRGFPGFEHRVGSASTAGCMFAGDAVLL